MLDDKLPCTFCFTHDMTKIDQLVYLIRMIGIFFTTDSQKTNVEGFFPGSGLLRSRQVRNRQVLISTVSDKGPAAFLQFLPQFGD